MTFSASRSSTGSEPNAARPALFLVAGLLGAAVGAAGCGDPAGETPRESGPVFSRVQPELFDEPGAQPNAWADYDADGDLDLFVGMRYGPNHLYRNDDGTFEDVAPAVGLADIEDTRAAAWGDYDADGDLDLYVGFPAEVGKPNRLYRNDGGRFAEVGQQKGVGLVGTTRQPSWVDYDGDGDLDLYVAMRDQANRLFRNDGPGPFTDVTEATGVGDPRRTVGVVWFDYDQDGDLDVHVSNQNGDEDAFLQNQGDGTFLDVATELGMNWPGRGDEFGSVAPAVTDYDNDGDLDLFIAAYGPDVLWSNDGDGTFTNVTDPASLGQDYHSTTAAWADIDHDGRADLIVTSFLGNVAEAEDHLFLNTPQGFRNVIPDLLLERGPSHGVAWADYDQDGDLDLAIANNNEAAGTHHLYRNELNAVTAGPSIQVAPLDESGHWTLPGAEVRIRDARTGSLLGSRLVDSGGGYCSQGATPVHFGLPAGTDLVDVALTIIRGGERVTFEREGVSIPEQGTRPLVFQIR